MRRSRFRRRWKRFEKGFGFFWVVVKRGGDGGGMGGWLLCGCDGGDGGRMVI